MIKPILWGLLSAALAVGAYKGAETIIRAELDKSAAVARATTVARASMPSAGLIYSCAIEASKRLPWGVRPDVLIEAAVLDCGGADLWELASPTEKQRIISGVRAGAQLP